MVRLVLQAGEPCSQAGEPCSGVMQLGVACMFVISLTTFTTAKAALGENGIKAWAASQEGVESVLITAI